MSLSSPWGTSTPPGGWQFRQAQTLWSMPAPVSQTLNSAVQAILRHRRDNPAVTIAHKLALEFDAVADELILYNAKLNDIRMDNPPKTSPLRALPRLVGVAAAVKTVVEGAAAPLEWLASGAQPVDKELAYHRAQVCAQCPKMGKGAYTDWFTVPVSEQIRRELSRRTDLKLETPYDPFLKVCTACLCPMQLKVWTPLAILEKHFKSSWRVKLWEYCWMLDELPCAPAS
jgi:hypothetical protein